ncbi:hypothetical protein D7X88_01780 [bacterium C-53]|nr:hypothetical protein [Lachnospiraceae bacterium]RKJ12169.1 hypothetical protein D7X88_01780 [bacterium C-53]
MEFLSGRDISEFIETLFLTCTKPQFSNKNRQGLPGSLCLSKSDLLFYTGQMRLYNLFVN